jgi:NADH-quinone oxidoreductase subunit F
LQNLIIADRDPGIPTIIIPAGTCGQASGANDLIRVAKREILAKRLMEKIHLRVTGCHGFCEMEPSVLIEPAGTFYPKLRLENMAPVVAAVANGEVLQDLLFTDPETGKRLEKQNDIPFFKTSADDFIPQRKSRSHLNLQLY